MRKIQLLLVLSSPLPNQAALEVCGVTQAGDKHLKPSFRLARPPQGCLVVSPRTVSGLGLLSSRLVAESERASADRLPQFLCSVELKAKKFQSMFNFLVVAEATCSLADGGDDRNPLPGVGSSL